MGATESASFDTVDETIRTNHYETAGIVLTGYGNLGAFINAIGRVD